jgi:hypothetical protein
MPEFTPAAHEFRQPVCINCGFHLEHHDLGTDRCPRSVHPRQMVEQAHGEALLVDKDREIARLRALLSDVEARNGET